MQGSGPLLADSKPFLYLYIEAIPLLDPNPKMVIVQQIPVST